ncbi:hypothetical protein BDW59DRAFT_136767 [Aspergillus cavernicola]|uniref:Uncharacterized protein n=1 Tax=Aspergillus cavernicola TaxID=176166 RepID=A0ABR4J504_9EURO
MLEQGNTADVARAHPRARVSTRKRIRSQRLLRTRDRVPCTDMATPQHGHRVTSSSAPLTTVDHAMTNIWPIYPHRKVSRYIKLFQSGYTRQTRPMRALEVGP